MIYNKLVTDYFFHASHVGELATITPFSVVVFSSVKMPPHMQLSLQCDMSGKITKALFKTNGNPYVIAGLEWVCKAFEGENVHEKAPIKYQQIMTALEMPNAYLAKAIALEKIANDAITELKKRNPI